MYIESIQIKNKQLQALPWHQARVNATIQKENAIDLAQSIRLPSTLTDAVYKCRVVYEVEKIQSIEFSLYIPLIIKTFGNYTCRC